MSKKILIALFLFAINTSVFSAYEEIECTSDSVFSEYSCGQCFTWGEKKVWDKIWLLSDLWINNTTFKKILYKEEQNDPKMINLNPSNVSWSQTPSSDWFWEYTNELEELYSEDEAWYVLEWGKQVTWLKSALGFAYSLDKNYASVWENIWLLVFPIATHNILENWEITIDNEVHNECVLFKSGEASLDKAPAVVDKQPKKLPETGPDQIALILLLALILGFLIFKFRTKNS